MKVFTHHVYEYRKGLRNLILYTTCVDALDIIKRRLDRIKIEYEIYRIELSPPYYLHGNSRPFKKAFRFITNRAYILQNEF